MRVRFEVEIEVQDRWLSSDAFTHKKLEAAIKNAMVDAHNTVAERVDVHINSEHIKEVKSRLE